LRIRVLASPRHAAEVMDYKRRIAEAMDAANAVLTPMLSVRLELASTDVWVPPGGEDDLARVLADLAKADPGNGVERVLALVGSLPTLEISFHQLGMAHTPGKHVVLRAMNDAKEYESIQRSFSELDEQDRLELYRARRRHKEAAVLLHELGHSLGVPHEVDVHTIMSPRYGAKVDSFSPAASKLMRLALDRELDPASASAQSFPDSSIAHLRATSASWVPDELERAVAALERSRAAQPAPAATASSAPAQPGPRALSAADRAILERAVKEQESGKMNTAWETAKSLFDAYPEVYEVQDLRCQLTLMRARPKSEVQNECAALHRLTPPRRDEPPRKRP
jgi:hypothetical protein